MKQLVRERQTHRVIRGVTLKRDTEAEHYAMVRAARINGDWRPSFVLTPRVTDYDVRTRTFSVSKSDHPDLVLGPTLLVQGRETLTQFYYRKYDCDPEGAIAGWWYAWDNPEGDDVGLLIVND